MKLSGRWIDTVHRRRPLQQLILDLDSSVSETYGRQQGTAYNGHFECLCYHPLFLFNQFGDLESVLLRRGNKASAKYWRRVLRPVVERLDHLMINEIAPFTELNPSAENLARYFYQQTSQQLQELTGGRVRVKDCTLFETDSSFARYYE